MSSSSELTSAIVAAQSAAVVVINEKASADARVVELTSALADADRNLQLAVDALADLRAEFAAYKAAHPDDTPPPPPPPATRTLLWGMSTPASEWAGRLAEVGPGLKARRLFSNGWTVPSTLGDAVKAGLYPIFSVKPGDWGDMLAGRVDARLDTLARTLATFDSPLGLVFHHEPGAGEQGALQEWALLPLYAKRRMGAICPKVKFGPIDNGFHFDRQSSGFTDADLDAYYTDEVLAGIDFLGADCYQGGTFANPGRDASPKIRAMTRFADRRGYAGPMGIGEYNGMDAAALRNAHDAVRADGRFEWACVFNSSANNRPGVDWVLTGERLAEFRAALSEGIPE